MSCISRLTRRSPSGLLLIVAALLIALTSGCGKKPLTSPQIRVITREMVFAAKNASGGKAEVGMRPETLPSGRSGTGSGTPSADHIYITLTTSEPGQTELAALRAVEKELDQVAARHQLLRENLSEAPGLVRFDYRRGAQHTHAIHIITPLGDLSWGARKPGERAPAARLAIIIDDLGYERAAADALFALPYPLTVSVLPHLPHSADTAEEAHRRGYQVMLHLPMESATGGARQEAIELRTGMTADEASRLLIGMLDTVPYAAGVNNHQGSLATANPQLMAAIMPALRERQLFFIDSRTTTATVAYDAAVRAGVPAASRKVFLDDTPTREAVRKQLALAVRDARKNGFAIAIGHPNAATLQALGEDLPRLREQGVGLVFASELVR